MVRHWQRRLGLAHVLIDKPVPTFPGHALTFRLRAKRKPREDSHGAFSIGIRGGSSRVDGGLRIAAGTARGADARLRVLQGPRRADLPAEARWPYAVLGVPRGELRRLPAGAR